MKKIALLLMDNSDNIEVIQNMEVEAIRWNWQAKWQ